MKSFENKVVVIPGGATGIGFGFAIALGQEGAKIVIAARRKDRLKEAVAKLGELGIDATYTTCDVTKLGDVEALADFAWTWKGHVDVVINNAGMMIQHAPLLDMPIEDIHRIFNVSIFGVVHGSKVFGKRFVEQGTPAAIYNVGSENSLFHGTPLNGAYVATKHSVFAFTQSLHEELPDFIDVSLICPGFVLSELGPEEHMKHGMPTDEFVAIAMKQLQAGEFFVVSHAYNMERINQRHAMVEKAFAAYAPRCEGDQQYDVRTLIRPILEQQMGVKLRALE
ncbi:MAG: SDR family NAD(P)-dependent oxidoreductase [Geminicoccaceae bacterium]